MSKRHEVGSQIFKEGSMSAFCGECGRLVIVRGRNWTHLILEIVHDHNNHIIVLEKVNANRNQNQ